MLVATLLLLISCSFSLPQNKNESIIPLGPKVHPVDKPQIEERPQSQASNPIKAETKPLPRPPKTAQVVPPLLDISNDQPAPQVEAKPLPAPIPDRPQIEERPSTH